mmetsp:Transcript_42456/g.113602  ORF Transcript_42456/g.113602 Transcript_42456/m.113602 type:complete len:208 (+) Transcript_42456:1338-1961(+)
MKAATMKRWQFRIIKILGWSLIGHLMSTTKLADNCCVCFTLATGVTIIATLDLIQGLLTVFLGVACLLMPETFKGHPLAHHYLYNETTMVAILVMSLIGSISAYFSWCAIKGIRNLDSSLLWKFFLWKAGRAFFFSLLLLSDVWKTFGTAMFGSYLLVLFMSTAWRAYLLWIIFSLYEMINTNDASSAAEAGILRQDADERRPIVLP